MYDIYGHIYEILILDVSLMHTPPQKVLLTKEIGFTTERFLHGFREPKIHIIS